MRTITLMTTFSQRIFETYASEFQKSWTEFLDPEIEIMLYVDDVNQQYEPNRIVFDLENTVPDLRKFKQRNLSYESKKFRDDAVRFSHKSYAICHAGSTLTSDVLIWLDADVIMNAPVTREFLLSHIPQGIFTSYLGRRKFSETGFLAFDLKNPAAKDFFADWKKLYDQDLILKRKGKTDCHAFDETRLKFENDNLIQSLDLNSKIITGSKNAFENVFGNYMKHHKGSSGELYAK